MNKEFLPKHYQQFILPPPPKSFLCKEFLQLQYLATDLSWNLRILKPPIAGWIVKEKGKLIRIPATSKKPENCEGPFWAFYVWHYDYECLRILYVTEAHIIDKIIAISEKQGDLTNYDLIITRYKYSRYDFMCLPVMEVPKKIEDALKLHPICLEMLYESNKQTYKNKDPWEVAKLNQSS